MYPYLLSDHGLLMVEKKQKNTFYNHNPAEFSM